jgi:hypothetical protein
MPLVLVHVKNEDPILAEIDELPDSRDTLIVLNHPRRRDGKDIHYLDTTAQTVVFPYERINFVEILPGQEEEEIISFVRE